MLFGIESRNDRHFYFAYPKLTEALDYKSNDKMQAKMLEAQLLAEFDYCQENLKLERLYKHK